MAKKIYCGVDVGGTKMLAALVDHSGEISATKKIPTPQKASATKIYNELRQLIETILNDNGIEPDQLRGIGIGVPGIVKSNHRDILRTPNIALANFPLAQRLSKAFGVKVVLGNDVNLGLLGEKWLGAGLQHKNIIGLFPGTGVGGAIIIDGKLIDGAQGVAGELGHMIIDQNSDKTSAGLYGTLEALASRRAIERDIREAVKEGQSTIITKLVGDKLDVIKSRFIAKSLDQKDKVVVGIVNDVCKTLGNACISMRHTFNPDLIIFGGGLMEACGHYMLPRIRRRSNANPFMAGIDKCKIVLSELGDNAVILGAVALIKQELKGGLNGKLNKLPLLKQAPTNKISVDNKTIKSDFYLRADGKVKPIKNKLAFRILSQKNILDEKLLKTFCKKKPEELLIVKGKVLMRVSKEGKEFLKAHKIAVKSLTLSEAIKVYNSYDKRRALVYSQSPAN